MKHILILLSATTASGGHMLHFSGWNCIAHFDSQLAIIPRLDWTVTT